MLHDITELNENLNGNDLKHRYKGKTPDEKFNTYDNTLDLIDKTKEW